MNNRNRTLLVAGALAATAAVGYAQFQTQASPVNLNASKVGQTFQQVLAFTNANYLKPVKVDDLLRGAINGMLASLNDQFTYYAPPEENKVDEQNLAGEFYGIGVLLAPGKDGVGGQVDVVYKDNAAARAGVQAGDRFLKIDGQDVSTASVNDIVTKVRGEKGTKVRITFGRGSSTYEVVIERSPVVIAAVETATLKQAGGDVAYIALNTFYNEKVEEQFERAVSDAEKRGVKKMILDLRDNGGGLLNAGVFVADKFLPSGKIVSLRDRSGRTQVVGDARKEAGDYTGKLVVLINGNSASASEIVAGALQDYKRATLIGEKSFGKGVAQSPFTTADGGRAVIVTNEWLTPLGRQIHGKGITPEITVKDTRYPTPLNFSGSGVPAGTKLTVNIGGRTVTATADKDGKFTFIDDVKRPQRSSSQGEATVDVKTDAELAKALEVLAK
ncbi:S41 family peptidase [Deinococcus maricopensis]|uniref:Carboxyl-terminal protease n=1 Tax=Deinococcus maricopensis (strain DSM 21211 / LMG 22137 / NRRL B-23946 / LB-34) TaxID=709986 RepID=E8UAD8_DEIML|nr:S41 family peptidase [Deinococcus maricopensis]ADV68027.1 carboxyl-terminal protease [Deinococcus maricopensis DSM 21211]